MTKMISWKDYCPNPRVPKLLTAQDLIKHHANLEAEATIERPEPELPYFEPEIKEPWSPTAMYVFIKSLRP